MNLKREAMHKKDNEAMVAAWIKRGAAMDAVKERALETYDYRANRAHVNALLELAYQYRTPRMSSGLVEKRRLFEKAWS